MGYLKQGALVVCLHTDIQTSGEAQKMQISTN